MFVLTIGNQVHCVHDFAMTGMGLQHHPHRQQSTPKRGTRIKGGTRGLFCGGTRRWGWDNHIRVLTQALPVTGLMSEVVKRVDVETLVCLLARQASVEHAECGGDETVCVRANVRDS